MRKKLAEDEIVVRNRFGGAVWAGSRCLFKIGKEVTDEGAPYRISRLVPKAKPLPCGSQAWCWKGKGHEGPCCDIGIACKIPGCRAQSKAQP